MHKMFHFPVFTTPVTAYPVLKNVHHKNICPKTMSVTNNSVQK